MSRCFPFPPPGYEKKARIADVDLLKKEKHKEKRHKKEKKDKEKREHKKYDEKHKDKKDKKEKSKEKKKDKERDKASISQEKQIPALVESCTGDYKLNPNISSNEKKQTTLFCAHIGEKPVETSLSNEGAVDKFVLDLCNRIKDDEKGYVSQSLERSAFTGRTNHDRIDKNETGIMHIDKWKKEDKRVDIRNVKEKNEIRGPNISGVLQYKVEEIPRNIEKSSELRDKDRKREREEKRESKSKNKDKEKKSHGKDKEKKKEEKNNQKIKVKDDTVKNGLVVTQNIKLPQIVLSDGDRNTVNQNKKLPQLVPNGDRNLILGENVKSPPFFPDGDRNLVIGQNLKLSQVPNKDGNLFRGQNIKMPPFVQEGERRPAVEVNLKKRIDTEANGFLHKSDVVPNKKLKPSPQPSIENRKKLAPCQTRVLTPDRKVPSPNIPIKVNNEQKFNGMLKKPPSSSSSSTSSSSKVKADQVAKAPQVKPPHPDTKYLSEVLSVPKIEELCDFDDEKWLFSRKSHVTTSMWPTEALETHRVWAEAMKIETADVYALPYVIPY